MGAIRPGILGANPSRLLIRALLLLLAADLIYQLAQATAAIATQQTRDRLA